MMHITVGLLIWFWCIHLQKSMSLQSIPNIAMFFVFFPTLSPSMLQSFCFTKARFSLILLAVNLGMQASFSGILLSDDFALAGVNVEEEVDNARTWRQTIAHDWRYMDLSQTSFLPLRKALGRDTSSGGFQSALIESSMILPLELIDMKNIYIYL